MYKLYTQKVFSFVHISFFIAVMCLSLNTNSDQKESIKISDIQSFRWDTDNQSLVLKVGSIYHDVYFSSRCWDIESAEKLEFQSWSNRTHLSEGDAIIPMSYRWGFDSPSNCFIKSIVKIES
jgi:hypothetical protein